MEVPASILITTASFSSAISIASQSTGAGRETSAKLRPATARQPQQPPELVLERRAEAGRIKPRAGDQGSAVSCGAARRRYPRNQRARQRADCAADEAG